MKKVFAVLTLLVCAVAVNAEPKVIGKWSGNGIKETESFSTTTRECQILWETKATNPALKIFQIYVYEDNGSLVSVAANTMEEGKDYTDIRLNPAKKYYLQINSAMQWKVVIGSK